MQLTPPLISLPLSHQLTFLTSYGTISAAVEIGVYLRGNDSLVGEARKAGLIGGFVLGLVYTAQGNGDPSPMLCLII